MVCNINLFKILNEYLNSECLNTFIAYPILPKKNTGFSAIFRLFVLLLQLFTKKNYVLNYIFGKPLRFLIKKCIDIYWFNILS